MHFIPFFKCIYSYNPDESSPFHYEQKQRHLVSGLWYDTLSLCNTPRFALQHVYFMIFLFGHINNTLHRETISLILYFMEFKSCRWAEKLFRLIWADFILWHTNTCEWCGGVSVKWTSQSKCAARVAHVVINTPWQPLRVLWVPDCRLTTPANIMQSQSIM